MTDGPGADRPPWAELLRDALHAAHHAMNLEGEERLRAFQAAQRISDARMQAGRAVGRVRRAGWDGNHLDLWKAAEAMASLSGSLKQYPQRSFLAAELERWREGHGRTAVDQRPPQGPER